MLNCSPIYSHYDTKIFPDDCAKYDFNDYLQKSQIVLKFPLSHDVELVKLTKESFTGLKKV